MTVYADYRRNRLGWLFGLTGWQLGITAAAALPVFAALGGGHWGSVLLFGTLWCLATALVTVPIRGRSAAGWLLASSAYTLGRITGWSTFRSRAAQGRLTDPDQADLPGVLNEITIHDGPPRGAAMTRPAVIQDHRTRCWAVTASLDHPGIALMMPADRDRRGRGLADVLDVAARTELLTELLLIVRSVPDDGTERALWTAGHRRPDGPALARRINDDLAAALREAGVRTEGFITLVAGEAKIAKAARETGGGVEGRAHVLYGLMDELGAALRAGPGATRVQWLTSPQLAVATRTGFAPGDRASIVAAHPGHTATTITAATHTPATTTTTATTATTGETTTTAGVVPWGIAGPSGADASARAYLHDAWASVSATIALPAKGAAMGALAPVLIPSEPGERRSLLVCYPILDRAAADRQTGSAEWNADMATALNDRIGRRPRAATRADTAKIYAMDRKVAAGNSITCPYALATVTVPRTRSIAEYGRRLDSSIRRAGFAPLRLDCAQDLAMIATSIPLGLGLTPRGDR